MPKKSAPVVKANDVNFMNTLWMAVLIAISLAFLVQGYIEHTRGNYWIAIIEYFIGAVLIMVKKHTCCR
jgi:hypothetical protein